MPKLTREAFLASIDDMMSNAQANLYKDGYVAPVLIGLTAKAEQFIALGRHEDVIGKTDLDFEQRIIGKGLYVLPAPFRDHPESVLAFLGEHKCVASIMIDEAWFAEGQVAAEIVQRDMSVSEHDARLEGVFVCGVWPREYATKALFCRINRDSAGKPSAGAVRTMVDGSRQPGNVHLVDWLSRLLPQPH